jgi:hypothetical protein
MFIQQEAVGGVWAPREYSLAVHPVGSVRSKSPYGGVSAGFGVGVAGVPAREKCRIQLRPGARKETIHSVEADRGG